MREPHRDLTFDTDTDEIRRRQRNAAGVNAVCKYAAAARVRNAEVMLHHRAGAADLVTDQRAEIGRQQLVKRILNAVSAGLVLRRDIGPERLQRRAVTARGSDLVSIGAKLVVVAVRLARPEVDLSLLWRLPLFVVAAAPVAAMLVVAHIALFVSDIEKSRAFYKDFLGFSEPFKLDKPDGSLSLTFIKVNDRQYIELFPGLQPGADRLICAEVARRHPRRRARGG